MGTGGTMTISATGGSGGSGGPAGSIGGAESTGGVSGAGGTLGQGRGGTSGAGGLAPGAGGNTGLSGMGGEGGITQDKARVVVLTDIGFDPDDEESLVRFLVYSNEFDVEALIAGTSLYLRTSPREDLIRRQLDAYEVVRPNLIKHAAGYPEAVLLRAITATGQPGYGLAFVGAGKSSAGSQLLIQVVDKADSRPIWVTVWGGSNTLAQALVDVRASRTAAELASFVARLRVYAISDQDDSGLWIRQQFPSLFYVVSPSDQSPSTYPRATFARGDTYIAPTVDSG
jgi:Protein of unknown function (DUF1593)